MDELITTKEAAKILGIKVQSLQVRICRGTGPFPVIKGAGRGLQSMFKKSDVENHLTERNRRA